MKMKEVCSVTGLTRKAVEYYESCALIAPAYGSNGYRSYGELDVERLKEITLLRRLGATVAEIRDVLDGGDRERSMAAVVGRATNELRRSEAKARLLQKLADGARPDRIAEEAAGMEHGMTIREKLELAFPGAYGRFISWHFGRFLTDSPDGSGEREEACRTVVDYLDGAGARMHLLPELHALLEDAVPSDSDRFAQELAGQTELALQDTEGYLDERMDSIRAFLAYKDSEAYRESPAYRLECMLAELQAASGYRETFIPAMKILSPAYSRYCRELEEAAKVWAARFPGEVKH